MFPLQHIFFLLHHIGAVSQRLESFFLPVRRGIRKGENGYIEKSENSLLCFRKLLQIST